MRDLLLAALLVLTPLWVVFAAGCLIVGLDKDTPEWVYGILYFGLLFLLLSWPPSMYIGDDRPPWA